MICDCCLNLALFSPCCEIDEIDLQEIVFQIYSSNHFLHVHQNGLQIWNISQRISPATSEMTHYQHFQPCISIPDSKQCIWTYGLPFEWMSNVQDWIRAICNLRALTTYSTANRSPQIPTLNSVKYPYVLKSIVTDATTPKSVVLKTIALNKTVIALHETLSECMRLEFTTDRMKE